MSSRPPRRSFLATTAAAVIGAASISGSANASKPAKSSRFATFNVYEFDTKQVQHSGDQQAAAAARIIQEVQPDILVVNKLTNNQQQDNRVLGARRKSPPFVHTNQFNRLNMNLCQSAGR